eukprot:5415158-Prymnesium_polylepis.1
MAQSPMALPSSLLDARRTIIDVCVCENMICRRPIHCTHVRRTVRTLSADTNVCASASLLRGRLLSGWVELSWDAWVCPRAVLVCDRS